MKFDFIKYAKSEGITFRPGPFSEVITDCIICGKEKHLYFNLSKNLWICHKCGESGNELRFIMAKHHINWSQAVEFVKNIGILTITGLAAQLKSLRELYMPGSIPSGPGTKVIIFPPKEAISVTIQRFPKFFTRRKFDPKFVGRLTPMICNSGKYAGRIIFPFTCDGHKSFVAYSSRSDMKPKTLNPIGSNNEDLLYGYDLFNQAKVLVVVEGITDMLRLMQFGFNSIALLGKNISDGHLYLLYKHPANEIVVCYDGDVWDDGKNERRAIKRISSMEEYVSKKVTIVKIPNIDLDPDKVSYKEWIRLYKKRVTLSQLRRRKRFESIVPRVTSAAYNKTTGGDYDER